MEIWKFAAFAIVCALLCAVLKQHGAGQASLLALAGCVGLLLTAMTVLTPVMTFLRRGWPALRGSIRRCSRRF